MRMKYKDLADLIKETRLTLSDYSFIKKNDDVFDIVDDDLELRYFFSSVGVNVKKEIGVKIFRQKELISCTPMEVFDSIGDISEIAFPSEKYIKSIVKDYAKLLYLNWFGTFFLYENENDNIIIAQVVLEDEKISINVGKSDAFNIKINGMNRTRFVCFNSFVE